MPKRPQRFKESEVARVARAMRSAGFVVSGTEVDLENGTFRVLVKGDDPKDNGKTDANEWD